MLWSIDSWQNRISTDQYHLTVLRAQVSTHRGGVLFLSYPLTNHQFQMIVGSSLFFPKIHMKYVVFMPLWPRTVKILISNWPWTQKISQLFKTTGGEDLFFHGYVLVMLRPIFVLWLVKIWQVSSYGKFMQHLESCFTLTAEADRLLCQLVMFLLDVQNEIQLLSRVFCFPWLVCLLCFWLRNASLVKIG